MDAPTKQPHAIGWYAAWIVLAHELYVASFKPIVLVARRFGMNTEAAFSAYAPILAGYSLLAEWAQIQAARYLSPWDAPGPLNSCLECRWTKTDSGWKP